jgi:hypothetical protein
MIVAGILLAVTLAYISIFMSTDSIGLKNSINNVSMPNVEFSSENSPVIYKINFDNNSANDTKYLYTFMYTASLFININYTNAIYSMVSGSRLQIFPLLSVYPQDIIDNGSNKNIEFNIIVYNLKEIFIGYNSSLYNILYIHEYLSGNKTFIQIGLHLKNITTGSEIIIPIWTEYNSSYYYTDIVIIY